MYRTESRNEIKCTPTTPAASPPLPPPKESSLHSRFVTSKSQHAFDEVPAIVDVPMASFEQDLEDDEFLPEISIPQSNGGEEWTCKKCTLVNSHRVKACVVCGGSKLKSISSVEDMTLRKGEFWSCGQCTLKNSLSSNTCSACKSIRQVPIISGQQTNFRPYTSSPAQPNQKPASYHHHNRQILATIAANPPTVPAQAPVNSAGVNGAGGIVGGGGNTSVTANILALPPQRVSRSPSPKHDRVASGAIPKVKFKTNNSLNSIQKNYSLLASQYWCRSAKNE